VHKEIDQSPAYQAWTLTFNKDILFSI